MKLILIAKRPETEDVMSFLFRSDAPLKWLPGQFLHYTLPHPDADDRGIARHFTIASAPFEEHVMLTTRFSGERSSSFKRALRQLQIGAAVEVDEPDGDLVYLVSPQHVTQPSIRAAATDLAKSIFHVSGPEPFVEATGNMLSGLDVPDTHVKRDYFPGYEWPSIEEAKTA